MHRLLVPGDILESDCAVLPKDAQRHLKVLRPKAAETVELFDGAGRSRVFRCGAGASFPLTADGPVETAPRPACGLTLFACVTKGSRWDWTIEKAVELGVTRIVPVISGRCVVRIDRADRPAKRDRWCRIAEDAARQSDAKWLPEICEAVDFKDSLRIVRECACFVGSLVNPPPEHLLAAVMRRRGENPSEDSFAVYVGPEGDFTPEELSALLEIAQPVTFGPSILRAETAAIFGVSVLSACVRS